MIWIERYVNTRSISCEMLVNGVIDDFPNTVVEGGPVVRVAKIHPWSFSYCFKALENLYTGCTVIV
jgi:hypothetical protein